MSKDPFELMRQWRRASVRLPTHVFYGIDVSDPDPANWREFGAEVEARANVEDRKSKPPAPTPGQLIP